LNEDGVNVANERNQLTFWDGNRERTETIAWEHEDRLGRNITVTENLLGKIADKEISVPPEKLLSGLNSINGTGENRLPEAKGERVYATHNGLIIFLRGNVVTSAFYPTDNLQSYFKWVTIPGTTTTVKSKWLSKWFLSAILN
jgi:hypothetical protein